jgi:hypothetical protein
MTFEEFKDSELRKIFFEELEKTITVIYHRYSYEQRSPKKLQMMLDDSREILFPGKPNAKLTFSKEVKTKDRLDLNTIINSMRIIIRKQELPITEYLLHLSAIHCGIAFIKIK